MTQPYLKGAALSFLQCRWFVWSQLPGEAKQPSRAKSACGLCCCRSIHLRSSRGKGELGAAPLFKDTARRPGRVSNTTSTTPAPQSGALSRLGSPSSFPTLPLYGCNTHTGLKRGTCSCITKQTAWNGVAFQSMGPASKAYI